MAAGPIELLSRARAGESEALGELCALYRTGVGGASNREEMTALVRQVVVHHEPETLTLPFERFWRGAYERLDDVEAWWHARELVYVGQEPRGMAPPQKHYFVTGHGLTEAGRLVTEVDHARWYADRIDLILRFFGGLTPSQVKSLQYRHAAYRDAQLREAIPDLTPEQIRDAFSEAFGEALEGDID